MIDQINKGGRPQITEDEKRIILLKIEPHLKSGLSIRKAVSKAQISRATFYRIMEKDQEFRDQIDRFKQYISVQLCKAIYNELKYISDKQKGDKEKNIAPQSLDKEDVKFLMWYAMNSNSTKEEWGRRETITPYDPEEEIQKLKKMIEEATTKNLIALK